MAKELEF